MAIALDVASSTSGTNASSLTWNHTCTGTGTDGILTIIAGFGFDPASGSINSATYNGSSAPAITGLALEDASFNGLAGFYQLLPATGLHSVVVTYGGLTDQVAAGAVSYTGVNQATPFGTAATASGSITTASVAVTSAAGELVMGGIASDSNGVNAITIVGGTSQWEVENVGSDTSYAQGDWTGAASVTVSWTQNATGWVVGGISLKPTGGAAAATAPRSSSMTMLGMGR